MSFYGKIYIDLNTFAGSRGATLYTLAHELTHFIENNAPEQYKVLADFLINEYDKTGKSMDERVKDKQKELEYLWDREVSYDEAFHEVVADSMQKLFNDGNLQNELVKLKQSGPEGAKVVQAIKDFLDKLIKRIRNIYAKLSTGSEDAETVAQMGESLQKLQKIFAAALVEASDNYTAYGAVDSGTVQMQAKPTQEQSAQKDITAAYQHTVDNILNGSHTDKSAVLLGYTPSIYQELGMPSLPFVIGPGHIYSAAKTEAEAKQENRYSKRMHYHGLGDTAVKSIYDATKDPVMIIAAKDVDPRSTPLRSTHSIVAIVDVGANGKHLLLPVEITAKRTVGGQEMDVNVLSSAYTKKVSELVREAVAIENTGDIGVYYVKKGATLPADSGVQFPIHLSKKIASGSIIHSFSEKVNMNILDPTQSRQFKRWFGDWQNDPQTSSKIVNADGTPKVVYHGTAEQFTVFSYGHIGSSTGVGILGDGFYFTDKKRLAKNYGGNVYPVYLRMKKPYMATESDVYKLRTTDIQAQGYDGVILRAPQGDVYMVFENTQIKSATNNVGTFDGNNPDIRYQARPQEKSTNRNKYSYEELISKPDMVVTSVGGPVPQHRADIIAQAKKNATKVGKVDSKDGSIRVHVNDIDKDVVIGTPGLKHGLDRRTDVNAAVTLMAGEILQNSIQINELTPAKAEADNSYVLIGTAMNQDGELYLVRSIINRFSNELSSMDVLYAMSAKKRIGCAQCAQGFKAPLPIPPLV